MWYGDTKNLILEESFVKLLACRHLVAFSVYFNSVQLYYPIHELRNLWRLGGPNGDFNPGFV